MYVDKPGATTVRLYIVRSSGIADEYVVTLTASDDPNIVQSKRVRHHSSLCSGQYSFIVNTTQNMFKQKCQVDKVGKNVCDTSRIF